MTDRSHIVVRKTGFLTALAYGVFGLLAVIVVCSTVILVYSVNVVDRKADGVLETGRLLITSLPDLQKKLPPALADTLADHRDPEYRRNLDVGVRLAPDLGAGDRSYLTVKVQNNGPETVTLLAAQIRLLDESETVRRDVATYLATPVMIDGDWRGPLLPGSTRQCSFHVRDECAGLRPVIEIADLRVWSGTHAPDLASAD